MTNEQITEEKDFYLIPMSEIRPDIRKLAVVWVENYGNAGFDLQNKHKLASDIQNLCEEYHQMKLKERITPTVKDMVKKIFGEEASNDPDILYLYEECTKQAIEEQVQEKLKSIREEIENISPKSLIGIAIQIIDKHIKQ